jgi:hypothetical protein
MTAGTDGVRVQPSEFTRTSAVAGIALGVLLLAGAASALTGGWGEGLHNWLILLHGANAGEGGPGFAALTGVRAVDVAMLVLAGLTFLGTRPLLGPEDRVWVGIAAALPVVGMAILLVTGVDGRFALPLGGLIIAWRMTKRDRRRTLGWLGVIANGLAFLLDVGRRAESDPAAADLIAVVYILLIVWLAWLAFRMLKPLPGRLVPVGTHLVGTGGGCRAGGSETTELFDLPIYTRAEGSLGTYVGVADATTAFVVDDGTVTLMQFLEAYDEDRPFEIRVEERGRLAAMTIDTGEPVEDQETFHA